LRVLKAVAELGYQPNHAARALKSGSARTIALIFPDDDPPVYANPFFTELAGAIEQAARRRGYALYMTTNPSAPGKLLERSTVPGRLSIPGRR
jgi:LacI family transcriptional regulator